MKHLKVLVKSIFLNAFRGEGKKRKGQLNGLLGMLISGGIFGLLFMGMTIFMGPIFNTQGLQAEFLTMIFLASQVIVLLFGTIVMVNIMFFSKDAEMMLYLPIKPITIFAAKIIYVYLTELMLAAFVIAVTGVTFGIICGFSVFYYLLLIVAILITPMVPLIISAILTVPIMYLISFLKNKSIITTIMLVGVFGTFMYFYMGFFGNLNNIDEENLVLPAQQIKTAMSYMYPNISLAKIITFSSTHYLLDVLIVLIATFGLLLISLLIASFTYRRGMAAQLEESRSKNSGKIKYEQNSALKSFLIKETRELIRNPGLAFYCFFQVIIAPIMVAFYGTMMFGGGDEGEILSQSLSTGMGFFFVIIMVLGINYTALSSISREGVNFNMSKSLPAPYSFQIRAKMILADLVMAAGIILSLIVMIFVVKADILQSILFAGFAFILGNAFNNFLIYQDAKNPKLDWESITVALKNSKQAFISILLSMAVGIPFLVSYIIIFEALTANLFNIFIIVFWLVFYGVAILLNILFRKILNNNVERLIAQHE